MSTTGRRLNLIAAAALLMAAALITPADAQAPKPWRHGMIEAKSDAGFFLMVTRGFAEKQGLKLDVVQFKTDIIALQALLAGEVDSFDGGPGGSILAAARGGDIKILGCQWPGLPYGIFVRNTINSVGELKGKTFAISAPAANPAVVARGVLEKLGVPASELRFANLGSDLDRFKAVAAGVADAAIVSNEYEPVAAKQGVKMLVAAKDVWPDYVRQCTMSSGKVLSSRADDAVRFIAAEISGFRHALADREDTLRLTRDVTGIKPDDPRPEFIYDDAVKTHAVDPEFSLPVAKLDWMMDQLVKDGSLPRRIDVAKVIAPDVRAKALAMLGK